LLEQKVDIRVIQVLLAHQKLETTAHYSQVDRPTQGAIAEPSAQYRAKLDRVGHKKPPPGP
jgi:site-specific recombinase XerC